MTSASHQSPLALPGSHRSGGENSRSALWLPATLVTLVFVLSVLAPSALAQSLGSDGQSSLGGSQDFLPVDEALPFSYTTSDDGVTLSWDIAPEHYLYKERISISSATEGVEVGEPEFSLPGEETEDEYFGRMTVFFEPVEANVPITLPEGVDEAELQVTYQGCAEAGLCYPPQTRDVLYYPGAESEPDAAPDDTGESTQTEVNSTSATGLAGFLEDRSLLAIVLVFFLLGLGLTFTPCVLPMVPIISALVSSRNTQTHGHALVLALSYVIGMALTYAAAGVITGLLGASFNLQAALQSPWVLGIFSALFVLFALAMFNVYDIQLPRALRDRLNHASEGLSGGRVASVFGIGALSALVVSPCVSAPLAGSLLYISTTQDAVVGGLSLFALGMGMGVPLILVAVGGRRFLPASGPWMNLVKAFYGIMLLAVAIWLLERLLPAWAGLALWGLLATVTGVQLGAFDAARAGWQRTWKGLGLVMFVYGLALLAGASGGASDPLKPLSPFVASAGNSGSGQQAEHAEFERMEDPAAIRQALDNAARQGQPVMLDFYADWCISCKVMERRVFSDPEVVRALEGITLLQIDMTDNTPEQQALLDELGLFGPPAILFYQPDGTELESRRVLGEMNAREFLEHLESVGF